MPQAPCFSREGNACNGFGPVRQRCNPCQRAYERFLYPARYPRIKKARAELKAKRTPDENRAAWRKYRKKKCWPDGLFDIVFDKQNGKCAICDVSLVKEGRVANVASADHCHNKLIPRGVLCALCNRGLGNFKDNTNYLEKAIEYLVKYES